MVDKKVTIKIGGDFSPIPMDKYTVQIADVNAITQFNQFKGEEQEMLNYQFIVLDDKPMEDGESTRGRYLWKRCSMSLNEKSWLGKLAKAAYGRDLTNEELKSFDPEAIVFKQVDVMVNQTPSKDGSAIYNNIVSFGKTVKPLEAYDNEALKMSLSINKKSQPIAVEDNKEETQDPDSFIKEMEELNKSDEVGEAFKETEKKTSKLIS